MPDDDNIIPFPSFQRIGLDEHIDMLLVDAYKLVGHEPVKVASLQEWSDEYSRRIAAGKDDPWRVAYTVIGYVEVSTVFLSINHRLSEGPPILFETMVFNDRGVSDFQARCCTWEEAEQMHKEAVQMVKSRPVMK